MQIRHPDPIVCLYDLNKCGGALIVDAMRTHPAVIIGSVLQENPFFVPPDEFLRELQDRKAGGKSREHDQVRT